MNYKEHVEKIKKICDKVEPNKVTVLTGKNGSGKSLVRKLIGIYLSEKLGIEKNKEHIVASTSLQQRTETRADFGAFCSVMHDDPTTPTGLETIRKIKALLKTLSEDSKRFFVIDEPEIGMGEELVAGLVEFLNSKFSTIPEFCYGVLIITHNRYIVENVKSDFLNLEDMSKDEWLNRKIVPTNLEEFEEDSRELFRTIQNIIDSKK